MQSAPICGTHANVLRHHTYYIHIYKYTYFFVFLGNEILKAGNGYDLNEDKIKCLSQGCHLFRTIYLETAIDTLVDLSRCRHNTKQ